MLLLLGFITVHFKVRQHTINRWKLHFSVVISIRSYFDVLMMDVPARGPDVRYAQQSV